VLTIIPASLVLKPRVYKPRTEQNSLAVTQQMYSGCITSELPDVLTGVMIFLSLPRRIPESLKYAKTAPFGIHSYSCVLIIQFHSTLHT